MTSFRFILGMAFLVIAGFGVTTLMSSRHAAPRHTVVVPASDWQPGQVIDILVLGTSLTAGGLWPEMLDDRLSSCTTKPLFVKRLARPGATSDWGLAALRNRLSDDRQPRPDLVLVEFAINDASLWYGLTLGASARNHRDIIKAIRENGGLVFLSTMNPATGWDGLERLGQAWYFNLYRELAHGESVGLVDSVPHWQRLSRRDWRDFVPDGLHPTDAGFQEVVVPLYEQALGPTICDPGPADAVAPDY